MIGGKGLSKFFTGREFIIPQFKGTANTNPIKTFVGILKEW
jgi:hypothetical protein